MMRRIRRGIRKSPFDKVITEWTEIHDRALSTMIHATVYLEGGVDFHLASHRVILVYLEAPSDSQSLPCFFRVVRMRSVGEGEEGFLRDRWERSKESCEAYATEIRALGPPSSFAGAITVVYYIEELHFLSYQSCRLDRPSHGSVETALRPRTYTILRDLITLCTATISLGLSYGYSTMEDGTPGPPIVGQHVQRWRGAKPTWVPLDPDRWETGWGVLGMYVSKRPESFTSGVAPLDLWATYLSL